MQTILVSKRARQLSMKAALPTESAMDATVAGRHSGGSPHLHVRTTAVVMFHGRTPYAHTQAVTAPHAPPLHTPLPLVK
jgi:hypothetical protein